MATGRTTRAGNANKHLGLVDLPAPRHSSNQVKADTVAKQAADDEEEAKKVDRRKLIASMEDKKHEEVQRQQAREYTPIEKRGRANAIEVEENQNNGGEEPSQENQVEDDKSGVEDQEDMDEVTEWETDTNPPSSDHDGFVDFPQSQIEGTCWDPNDPSYRGLLKGAPGKSIRKRKNDNNNKSARKEIKSMRTLTTLSPKMLSEEPPGMTINVKRKALRVPTGKGKGKKQAKNGRPSYCLMGFSNNEHTFSPGVNNNYLKATDQASWHGTASGAKAPSTTSCKSAPSLKSGILATVANGGGGRALGKSSTKDTSLIYFFNVAPPGSAPLLKTSTSSKIAQAAAKVARDVVISMSDDSDNTPLTSILPPQRPKSFEILAAIDDENASPLEGLHMKKLQVTTGPHKKRKSDEVAHDHGVEDEADRVHSKKAKSNGASKTVQTLLKKRTSEFAKNAEDVVEAPTAIQRMVKYVIAGASVPSVNNPCTVGALNPSPTIRRTERSPIIISSDDERSS
ncbi:hypothetical protein OBBRIDRAFT_839838 [Obba rivulosa]|uniref:Uncharacterized protein n=1 Tax=Obba rivulosa TaxID=1052685 RepID=A0A8E2DJ04_9APHY|nr:hypothetical protein OBBRIDRAFT_839838 [Obba rivulosa]